MKQASLLLLLALIATSAVAGELTDSLRDLQAVKFNAAPEIQLQIRTVIASALVDAPLLDAAPPLVRFTVYRRVRNMSQLLTGMELLLLEVPDHEERFVLSSRVNELKRAVDVWLAAHHYEKDDMMPQHAR